MILRLVVASLANILEVALAVAHVWYGDMMTYATAYLDSASGANCSNDGSPCCYKLENTAKKIISVLLG